MLEKMETPLLGIIKNAADVPRDVVDGKPVVLANKKAPTAKAYVEIAIQISQLYSRYIISIRIKYNK